MSLSEEICTDLDYADDVSLLANMLEVLVLALEILHEESCIIVSHKLVITSSSGHTRSNKGLLPRKIIIKKLTRY